MARRRDFVRGAGVISQKRLTSWFTFSPTNATFTGAGGTIIFSLNAAALALRPFTIVRSRFLISVISDQITASENYGGAVGMAVVSDQAVAVGVTAVPTPITDMGSDLWFLHQLFFASVQIEEASGNGAFLRSTNIEIDSKAMRKVDIGQDLVVVGELAQTSGFNLTIGGRMLVKVN